MLTMVYDHPEIVGVLHLPTFPLPLHAQEMCSSILVLNSSSCIFQNARFRVTIKICWSLMPFMISFHNTALKHSFSLCSWFKLLVSARNTNQSLYHARNMLVVEPLSSQFTFPQSLKLMVFEQKNWSSDRAV